MPSPAASSTRPPSLFGAITPRLSATALEEARISPAGSYQINPVPDPGQGGPNPVGHRRNGPRCHPLPYYHIDGLAIFHNGPLRPGLGMSPIRPNSLSITGIWRVCGPHQRHFRISPGNPHPSSWGSGDLACMSCMTPDRIVGQIGRSVSARLSIFRTRPAANANPIWAIHCTAEENISLSSNIL